MSRCSSIPKQITVLVGIIRAHRKTPNLSTMKKLFIFLTLSMAITASGQRNDWENETVIQKNRLPARAFFIPFAEKTGDREMSLNGTWKFRWAPTPEKILDAPWTTLSVPGNWEVNGFGTPIYSSSGYTFKVAPPFVMQKPKETFTSFTERNPTGEYIRTFSIPDSWGDGGNTFLRFDGVISAFYVYINGKEVGYSQGSNHPSEFDITNFLRKGDNEVRLLVHKYSDGSYLEDQDAWRFGGVHRNVTLFHTPSIRLADFTVRTLSVDKDYRDFTLQINPKIVSLDGSNGEGYTVLAILSDAEGQKVAELTTDVKEIINLDHKAGVMNEWFPQRGRMKFPRMETLVKDAKPWTAETPYLYTLRISVKDEKGRVVENALQKIGFRQLEIRNGMFLVNGKQVRFRGVNRVEHDPITARFASEERMLQDIRLMKSANINAVRTAHSPACPRWYELCDSLGLYILDEADCENHGVRGEFSSTSAWNVAMMDRVIRLAERDKNHPCVVFWSLGNESGYGANHSAMAGWLHEFDPTRFVHYEGAQGTTEGALTEGVAPEPDPVCVDVISRFYPRVMQEYLNPGMPEGSDKERAENARWEHLLAIAQREWRFKGGFLDGVLDNRPVLTSEYAHCMGNALGNFKDYWDEIYSNPRMLGGFIWDWVDQGIIRDGWVHYGGDFNDKPNLKAFCLNGVVRCDRSVTAKYHEVKHVYAPVQFSRHNSEIYVINRNHHTGLRDFSLSAVLSINGKKQKPVSIDLPEVAPGDSAVVSSLSSLYSAFLSSNGSALSSGGSAKKKGDVRLNLIVSKKGGKDVVIEEQFPILGSVLDFLASQKSSAKKKKSLAGTPVEIIRASFFRAPTDNDKSFGNWLAKDWQKNNLSAPEIVLLSQREPTENASERVEEYRFANGSITVTTVTTLLKDGSVDVVQEYECKGELPELPRMGMQIVLPKSYELLEYYGRGPWDTFPDRWQSCHVGLWQSTVSDEYTHFPVPQDSGNHGECASVLLKQKNGKSFRVNAVDAPFSFSALHYTPQDISAVRHDHELKEGNYTVLSIDCAVLGIGNSSCGPGVLKKYSIDKSKKHRLHVNIQF